ncbi:MAG: transcription termination/antitermination protein NusG [Cytophagales bacterium]|nr:transcription termination/antitermination protein NusG [Cytophagales bacterium]
MSEVKWYVIRAVSGQEKKVKGYIESEISRQNLQDYVPQILIPSEKVFQMKNGKKKIREKSFFPGYVLISADIQYGEVSHIITSTPGVIGFLSMAEGTSKVPVPLRQSEINRILGRVDETDLSEEKLDISFVLGEVVKVMDGPFNSFTGTVEEIFEEKKKLNVMVKIFGRNTPVELNFIQVEKMQ